MKLQETLAALRGIANTPANMLTSEEKRFVSSLAKANGVTIKKRGCNSCYIDAAVELFGMLSKEPEVVNDDGRKYVLKAGVNVIYNGVHVNEATLTDKMAEALIRAGLSKKHFSRLPSDAD